jgi:hypothetical protein
MLRTDTEVAAEYRGAHLDRCDCAYPPFSHGTVAEPLYAVPDSAADRAHAKGTAEVVEAI